MKHSWFNSVIPIAILFSFRMLGLFMLIPVFTVFATQLEGATPFLTGIALGSYGLSQGLLQMPLGMLSDRFGRKPILTVGLLAFACGSLLGAFSQSIYMMILARILQGMGAIGSVLIALVADLTSEEQRTKAMAVIGMTIGLSFSLAMVISPALTHHYGLAGIFYLTTFLALVGLLLLHFIIPTPKQERFHYDSETSPSLFKTVLRDKHLQRLNVGIFLQHFILTATFYAIPMLLQRQVSAGHLTQTWHFYLPLMIGSFLLMMPFIIFAEKKRHMKTVFIFSVGVTSLMQLGLAYAHADWPSFCVLMLSYFIAFNILEATLPSLISRQAGSTSKGTAMGIYSSSQFLGIFIGGSVAGLLYQWAGIRGLFIGNGLFGLIWLWISFFMKFDTYLVTLILGYPAEPVHEAQLEHALQKLTGVKEVLLAKEEQVIYLRVNKGNYQSGSAEKLIRNGS